MLGVSEHATVIAVAVKTERVDWSEKLRRRVQALPDGRYMLILTRERDRADWTVQQIGKVER